jgi:hypothetical protein
MTTRHERPPSRPDAHARWIIGGYVFHQCAAQWLGWIAGVAWIARSVFRVHPCEPILLAAGREVMWDTLAYCWRIHGGWHELGEEDRECSLTKTLAGIQV